MAKSEINIYLETFGQKILTFPVNPSELVMTSSQENSTYQALGLGEVSEIGNLDLKELSFESFFPLSGAYKGQKKVGLPYLSVEDWALLRPQQYVDIIELKRSTRRPARLVISGTDINMLVTIPQFDITYKAGEHEDIYFSITFQQYREVGIRKLYRYPDGSLNYVPRPIPPTPIVEPKYPPIGSDVIVTGVPYTNSQGSSSAGKAVKNFKGKINMTHPRANRPIHISDRDGVWLGWLTEKEVKLA